MSYYLDEIKREIEDNNTLPNLSSEVASISDDLFDSLDNRTFVPEDQQAVEKILTYIRKKKADVSSRDTAYKTNLQNIADSTAAIPGLTGKDKRREKKILREFQAKKAEMDMQYLMGTMPAIGVTTTDVQDTITGLKNTEEKYKNLYQHYRKYKPKNNINKTIKHKTPSTIKSADDIFHVIPTTSNTFAKKIQKVTIGDKEYTDNITINGIGINSTNGDILISDTPTIKIKGKKIPRDQDMKLSYAVNAITTVEIDPGPPPLEKDIIYKQPYEITLQAEPKFVSKREEKEKQQEKKNKKKGEEGKMVSPSSSSSEKNESKEKRTWTQKLKNLVSGTSHTAATVLSAPITIPIEGAAALGKMGVQAAAGTANHVLIGGIRDTIEELKRKNISPKTNMEAALWGATLGIVPGLKLGRGLTKGVAKTGKRTLEMLSSVWGKGRHDIKTSGKRKKDYSLANKKGFLKRGGETMNQIGSGWSPTQPKVININKGS